MYRLTSLAVISAVAVPAQQCEVDNVQAEATDQDVIMSEIDEMICLSRTDAYTLTAVEPGSSIYYVDRVSTGWSPSRLVWFDRPRLDAAFDFAPVWMYTYAGDSEWTCHHGTTPNVSAYSDGELLGLDVIVQTGFPLCPSDTDLMFYSLGVNAY